MEKKVICKKNRSERDVIGEDDVVHVMKLSEGNIYYMRDMGDYTLVNETEKIPGGVWYPWRTFNEYFYTPEETVNILRTELIDKCLKNLKTL